MPSPEQHEGDRPKEQTPSPYYQAARFAGEQPAGQAYFEVQETIHGAECDLSAYRFHVARIWHVAVVGEAPPEEMAQQLSGILAAGERVTLSPELVQFLHERGIQARRRGPWSEGHYRPGKRL